MLKLLTAVSFLLLIPPDSQPRQSGWLSAYAMEPTIGTFNSQLYDGDIELGHDVYLATANCERIGETGKIIIGNNAPLDYQVFDCAGDAATVAWMLSNNIIAEVDYFTWQRYGLGRAAMWPNGE